MTQNTPTRSPTGPDYMKIFYQALVAFFFIFSLTGCYATKRTVVDLNSPAAGSQQVSARPTTQSTARPMSQQSSSAPRTESGLTRISQNPSVSASVARSICEPQARAAGAQAASQYRSPNTRYRANCRKDYFGNYDCSGSSYIAGGAAGGFAAGMESGRIERQARKAAYLQCLAPLGWTEN